MPRTVSDGGEDLAGDGISSRTGSRRHADNTHHGYKVGFPPKKGAFAEFSEGVKETFFADDPLREYKDQTKFKKLWLGLQHIFPMLDWGRHYTLGKFKGDLIAGMTIASLCIPQVRTHLLAHDRCKQRSIHPVVSIDLSVLTFATSTHQDIGYAKLAGLEPQYGLCKCTQVSLRSCCDENFARVGTADG